MKISWSAALVLGPASSLLYGSSDDISVALSFISTNVLIISMVSSVLHILILVQCRSTQEVYCYVKAMGPFDARLSGQIMVFRIIIWILGDVVFLWSQVKQIGYFYASIVALLVLIAPPVTYGIIHSIAALQMTRHAFAAER